MIHCPNKNLSEWKELVDKVGEDIAYFKWNQQENEVQYKQKSEESSIAKQFVESKSAKWYNGILMVIKNRYNDAVKLAASINKENPGTVSIVPVLSTTGAGGRRIFKIKINDQLSFPLSQKSNVANVEVETSLSDTENKIARLQKAFNVPVIIDTEIEDSGQVIKAKDNTISIKINPNKLFKDTVIHEFGHIYIDLLGGLSNPFITKGVSELKNTKLWNDVKALYPELTETELSKEVLATAIGMEGSKLFDNEKQQSWFKTWITAFYNGIKRILGIENNVAKELARQILSNEVNKELTGEIQSKLYRQKDPESNPIKEAIDTRITSIVDKLADTLKLKVAIYKRSKNKEYIESIKNLLERLQTNKNLAGLIEFVDRAKTDTDGVFDRLQSAVKENKLDTGLLRQIKQFSDAYNSISDISTFLDATSPHMTDAENRLAQKYIKQISDIVSKKKRIDSLYTEYGRAIESKELSKFSNIQRNEYIKKYTLEFKKSNPKKDSQLSDKEYKAKTEEYVNNLLAKNTDEIAKAEEDYIAKLLIAMPRDIGQVSTWLLDPKSINNPIMALAVKMLDKADFNAKQKFLDHLQKGYNVFKEFYNESNKSNNQQKLYDDLIEDEVTLVDGELKKTGEKSQHYVSEYFSEYENQRRIMFQKASEADSVAKRRSIIVSWFKDNTITIDSDDERISYPKPKWKNPQFKKLESLKKTPTWNLYNFILETNKLADELVPDHAKLKNRLPGLRKTSLENITETGITNLIKENLTDKFKKKLDDTSEGEVIIDEFQKVLVNEEGKERQYVPIHLRNRLEKKDQSFDVMSLTLSNLFVALNYDEKATIQPDLELLKDLISQTDISKTSGVGNILKINAATEKDLTMKGKDSNLFKALTSVIEDRLYGIHTVDAGEIAGVNINKLAGSIIGWSSDVMLVGNWMASTVNILQGKINTWVEGVGGDIIKRENIRAAETKYWKDSVNWTADIGSLRPSSLTNLLGEYFDTYGDFSSLDQRFSDNSRLKGVLKSDSLHGLTTVGEHYIQSTLTYSILDSIKIVDTESSLIDAYEVSEEGKIQLKKEFKDKKVNIRGQIKPIEDIQFEVSRLVRKMVADLNGEYGDNNQSMAQRYAIGKLAFNMRKWIIKGTLKRWRGVASATKTKEELKPEDIFYSDELAEDQEGNYVSAIRFISTLIKTKDKLSFELLSINWNELTDAEKANIKKAVTELTLIMAAMIASNLLRGMAGDEPDKDKKKQLYLAAFFTRRVYQDLAFYANPFEVPRLLRSPAASVSMLENTGKLLTQATHDLFHLEFERYKNKPHKGDTKLWKDFKQILPFPFSVIKQYERYDNIKSSVDFLYNTF